MCLRQPSCLPWGPACSLPHSNCSNLRLLNSALFKTYLYLKAFHSCTRISTTSFCSSVQIALRKYKLKQGCTLICLKQCEQKHLQSIMEQSRSIPGTTSPSSLLLRCPPSSHRSIGSQLEVQPQHLTPCTLSEMLGSPDKSFHFTTSAEGAQCHLPKNTCQASLCKPTSKQRGPYKPRTSLSLSSHINLAWPPLTLAKQQLQQLHGEHLLWLWGKLRQVSYINCLQAQRGSSGACALGSHPWSSELLSPSHIPTGNHLAASLPAWLRSRVTSATSSKHWSYRLHKLKSALCFQGRDWSWGVRIFLLRGTHHPLAHSHC